jgi:Arc/MetJ-type ribon-helix-helix transcriptional regulator
MKTLKIEVPERLAEEIAGLVKAGWFLSEGEVARQALVDFIRRFQPELQEQFQRQDIAWALDLRKTGA